MDIASPNMELIVLSELINNPEKIQSISLILKDDHFDKLENRNIFRILKQLSKEHNGQFDPIILMEFVKTHEFTRLVGGTEYISELPKYSNGADFIMEHVQFLDRCYRGRTLNNIAVDIMQQIVAGEDPSEVIGSTRDAIAHVLPVTFQKTNISNIMDVFWENIQKGSDFIPGLPLPSWATNFKYQLHEGIRRKSCVVLQAPSTNGKTTLAMQTGIEYADAGFNVIYLTTEEGEEAFGRRVAANITKTNNRKIKEEAWRWQEYKAMEQEWVRDDPDRFIIYQPNEQWDEAEAKVLEFHNIRNIDVVIVDYIQRFKNGQTDNRIIELEDIARKALLMAHEMNAIVILVSQENDKGEAAWSTGIYKVADIVWSIKFESKDIESQDFQIKGKIRMKKNRIGDGQGEIDIWLVREHYTFYPSPIVEEAYYDKEKAESVSKDDVSYLHQIELEKEKPVW